MRNKEKILKIKKIAERGCKNLEYCDHDLYKKTIVIGRVEYVFTDIVEDGINIKEIKTSLIVDVLYKDKKVGNLDKKINILVSAIVSTRRGDLVAFSMPEDCSEDCDDGIYKIKYIDVFNEDGELIHSARISYDSSGSYDVTELFDRFHTIP